jgi:hypothetical protein
MNLKYLQLPRPFRFVSPFEGNEFVALVYVDDKHISPEEQEQLSDQIVTAGCRYAVCAGHLCSSWDNSIDMADLRRNNMEINEKTFVMTSWHEDEPVEDIVFHFLNVTWFDDFVPENFLVVILGGNSNVLADIRKEVEAQTTFNRIAGGFSPPASTPPDMRVRIRRFPKSDGP